MDILRNAAAALLSLFLITSPVETHNQQPSPPPTPHLAVSPTPLPKAIQSDSSRNWAGYSATNGTYTGVSGTWTIPHIQPTHMGQDEADATWVGIGGLSTRDLIQAGTQASADASGHIAYEVFYETLPQPSQSVSLPVSAGDTIHVDLTKKSDSLWNATIQNLSSGKSVSLTIPYNSSYSSAEWIEEAPSTQRQVLPLDDFGTITISHATAIKDGTTITAAESHATALSIKGFGNNTLAEASILDRDGASFTVSRATDSLQPTPEIVYRMKRFPFLQRHPLHRFLY